MLSEADNELLCRVGPGTAMGAMLREYWWPVLRSERLVAGEAPIPIRLMGEDFVAFRVADGRVGVVDERCPHRGVSLRLARNEDCGLRCILHGWKIGVDGNALETPNEKDQGKRLAGLKIRYLPLREAGGMIWVWAGKGTPQPFPNYAFNDATEISVMVGYIRCNWFQVMETLWDPSHVHILHFQGETFEDQFGGIDDVGFNQYDGGLFAAGFEGRDEPFGFSYRFTEGVCSGGGMPIWTPTVMPSWVYITSFAENPTGDRAVLGHVPIDDENMMLVQISYNMNAPIGEIGQRTRLGMGDPNNFVPENHNSENNWNQDREAMNNGSFTGIGMGKYSAGILLQDQAALESMGRISDRRYEQIGPADHGIVKGRQVFLNAVKAHRAGAPALGVTEDVSQIGL
jgi:phenylpropionate dioxygenase-like ring-hydroxylating dioxygenase large terminal subunit